MSNPEELASEYLNRPASIDVGREISRGMTLVTNNLGLTVGATWLAIAISIGVHFLTVLGWFVAIVLGPALVAGLELLFVRRLRGEAVAVGDMFAVFSNGAAVIQLAIAGILVSALVSVGMMLLVLPGIYLAVCYSFVLLLVLDKHLEFWPAMEVSRRVVQRHWLSMFGVLIVSAIVAMLGLVAVFVGVLLTVPIALAAVMCAYEDLFGAPPVVTQASQV